MGNASSLRSELCTRPCNEACGGSISSEVLMLGSRASWVVTLAYALKYEKSIRELGHKGMNPGVTMVQTPKGIPLQVVECLYQSDEFENPTKIKRALSQVRLLTHYTNRDNAKLILVVNGEFDPDTSSDEQVVAEPIHDKKTNRPAVPTHLPNGTANLDWRPNGTSQEVRRKDDDSKTYDYTKTNVQSGYLSMNILLEKLLIMSPELTTARVLVIMTHDEHLYINEDALDLAISVTRRLERIRDIFRPAETHVGALRCVSLGLSVNASVLKKDLDWLCKGGQVPLMPVGVQVVDDQEGRRY